MQCFIQWSSGLGDHFANQSVDLPFGVTHQFFGSRDGILRFYPCVCKRERPREREEREGGGGRERKREGEGVCMWKN